MIAQYEKKIAELEAKLGEAESDLRRMEEHWREACMAGEQIKERLVALTDALRFYASRNWRAVGTFPTREIAIMALAKFNDDDNPETKKYRETGI